MYEPLPYGELKLEQSTMSLDSTETGHTFHFQMAKPLPDRWANGGPADETEFMKSIVHVSIDQDTSSVRFEVDLGGLPSPHYTDGNEVIVRFHADDFNNE